MGRKPERDIEINEEHEHRRRSERVRDFGRVLMMLVLLAAATGAFGNGAVSRGLAESAGVRLEYERLARYNSPERFKLRVPAESETVRITVDSKLLERINVERIDPEPKESRVIPGGQVWIFPVSRTNGSVEITVHYRGDGFGLTEGRFDVEGRGAIHFRQFCFP